MSQWRISRFGKGLFYVSYFVDNRTFSSWFGPRIQIRPSVTNRAHRMRKGVFSKLQCVDARASAIDARAQLEKELCAQLHQTRRRGADDLAKGRTGDISVDGLRSEELGVIEDIECLDSELQGFGFGQTQILQQRHVVVVHSGSIKESPRGSAKRSEGIFAEERGVEIGLPIAGIVVEIERASGIVRFVDTKVVDAVWLGTKQRVVAEVDERHGKSAAEMGDAGEFPSFR